LPATKEQQIIRLFSDYQAEAVKTKIAYADVSVKGNSGPSKELRAELGKLEDLTNESLGPNYLMVDPYGDVVDRQHVLDRVRSGDNLFGEYTRDNHSVTFHGATAIYLSVVTIRGQRMGVDITGQYREMHILQKRRNKWVVLATQMTKVDPTHHPNR
jgi:hypothetical protein